jgi:hypothetical protein
MHLSHTRYSVGLQRRIILEITAPSLWCRRSVTNSAAFLDGAQGVESHHGFEQAEVRSTVSRRGLENLLTVDKKSRSWIFTQVKGISVGSFTVKKMQHFSMMRLPQGICCSIQFPKLCTEPRKFYIHVDVSQQPAWCNTLLFFGNSACRRATRRGCSSTNSSGSPTCCRRTHTSRRGATACSNTAPLT